MAYRELGMIEIREIIRRWIGGDGVRAIARGARVDRKTVVRYVAAAQAIGVVRGGPPVTDEQLTAVRRLATPVREPALSDEMQSLLPYRTQITTWLTQDELRLTKVHRRLGQQGIAVSYATLYRFARTQCDFGQAAITVRVAAAPPGEAAEVDFGFLGLWRDPLTGQRRRVHGLLITLCASRYAYLHISVRQDLATVLDGLEAAWAFFGGVVRRVVVDNLTPVVTRADRYTPTLARVMLEYAQYRGFVVDPAVVHHATGKPKVERGIPYCRQDFFRGEMFRDLTDMQARAVVWCRELAGARLHGTTRQVPRVVFEAHEQAALLPLAPEPFDRPTWAWATVHPDHHIQFQRALYSVPTRYIGERLEVRGDSRVVRIYHRGELIKLHAVAAPGHPATDYADYPAARVPYAMRGPRRLHPSGAATRPRARTVRHRPAERHLPVEPPAASPETPAPGGALWRRACQRRLCPRTRLRTARRPPRRGHRPGRR